MTHIIQPLQEKNTARTYKVLIGRGPIGFCDRN
jgi:hypothetical protein